MSAICASSRVCQRHHAGGVFQTERTGIIFRTGLPENQFPLRLPPAVEKSWDYDGRRRRDGLWPRGAFARVPVSRHQPTGAVPCIWTQDKYGKGLERRRGSGICPVSKGEATAREQPDGSSFSAKYLHTTNYQLNPGILSQVRFVKY